MQHVRKSALVPYSAQSMFALVDDIDAYPEFLPWCADAKVLNRTAAQVEAQIVIGLAGLKQAFSTRNHNHPPGEIRLELLEGPFQALRGSWHFRTLSPAACKVELHLDYQLRNSLLNATLGRAFEQITTTLVDAFVRRAESVYG
jgi:ribosome-associated toxin RatA of RatAB toxin-antitoxin module